MFITKGLLSRIIQYNFLRKKITILPVQKICRGIKFLIIESSFNISDTHYLTSLFTFQPSFYCVLIIPRISKVTEIISRYTYKSVPKIFTIYICQIQLLHNKHNLISLTFRSRSFFSEFPNDISINNKYQRRHDTVSKTLRNIPPSFYFYLSTRVTVSTLDAED